MRSVFDGVRIVFTPNGLLNGAEALVLEVMEETPWRTTAPACRSSAPPCSSAPRPTRRE
jgi:hypothetical protein